MSVNNHVSRFRPLCAGIRIVNPKSRRPGTLGFIGISNDGRRWIVSCHHVLIRPPRWTGDPFAPGEAIHQPRPGQAGSIIARTVADRRNSRLDCAAAPIEEGIDVSDEILDVGSPEERGTPERGMLVVKSGMATGVTRGKIKSVVGNMVRIEPRDGEPPGYELSKGGDSGALWLEEETLAPVALHRKGNRSGTREFALARPIQAVLDALRLDILRAS